MRKIFQPQICFIAFTFLLLSCENKSKTKEQENETILSQSDTIIKDFTSRLRLDETLALGTAYTDTVDFVGFNDQGDDFIFSVAKNKDTIGLIYNTGEVTFVRGDKIAIQWKMDSLRPAGDPDYLDHTEFLIGSKLLKPLQLSNKKIKFLWRKNLYNQELKMEVNSIVLNDNYIKTITEPEKAALAYVATFIGNECEWDGEPTESRSNLRCRILDALGLGYQCSNPHLDLLRFWFRSNKDILKELENCPTVPDGATIQNTFDEINLEVKGNQIIISFKVNGINMRENISYHWTEKHIYEFKENQLVLMKKDVSPVKKESM